MERQNVQEAISGALGSALAICSGGGLTGTPGDSPLKFEKQFEIRSDHTTGFTTNFSLIKQGQIDRYVFQPVVTEVEVGYEDT